MKMNLLNKVISLVILFFVIIILSGCKEDPDGILSVKSNSEVPSISEEVRYIDKNKFSMNLISSDSSSFTFKKGEQDIDNLSIGNIIVSDHDFGYLRKIKNIQSLNGQIIIQTELASLTDAIESATISFSKQLSRNDIAKTLFSKPGIKESTDNSKFEFEFINTVIYDHDGNLNTTHDQIVLNGQIELDPWIGMYLEIKKWQLKEMKISLTITENMKVKGTANLVNFEFNKEKLFKSFQLNPFTVFVGWLPIVIVPYLNFYLGANGKIMAEISTDIEQNAQISAGVRYVNNSWEPFNEVTHNFLFREPTFSAEANFQGYVKPQMELMIYGILGPYTNIKLSGECNVSILPNPAANLYVGIYAGIGVKLKILNRHLADWEKPDLISVRVKLWELSSLNGKISGNIKNAINNSPLNGVKIIAYKNNVPVDSSLSNSLGIYEISLPVYNNYTIVFSKSGFISAEYHNVNVRLLGNTILETVLQVDLSFSGNGIVSGKILNALSGSGVNGVLLKLRKGINVSTGSILSQVTTGSNGNYTFNNIPGGNYTVETSAPGFNASFFSVICIGGSTTPNQDASITPILQAGETRIILTWGELPPDLDSHLTGPLPDGSRFHMYYQYKGNLSPWPTIVNLDLDDVSSYGPETTTLYNQIDGIYRFSVHDYTNRHSTNSVALSNSSAQVRVYQGSLLVAHFNVPPNKAGTLWVVFEMNGSVITPINTFSYVNNPGDITRPLSFNGEKVLNKFPPK
jgi:hypothetical protein